MRRLGKHIMGQPIQKEGQNRSTNQLAVSSTIHCLKGCIVGEVVGLIVGVTLDWHPLQTAIVATILAYISGFSFALLPSMKHVRQLTKLFKAIWLAEAISIGVMEIVINLTDYFVGGMEANSILEPIFWNSLAVAILAGFVLGYPANYLMVKYRIRQKCP